jgi:hypothetical protein
VGVSLFGNLPERKMFPHYLEDQQVLIGYFFYLYPTAEGMAPDNNQFGAFFW